VATSGTSPFLSGLTLRPLQLRGAGWLQPLGLALGSGASALEVVVATAAREPALPSLRSAWKERSGGRAAPLLIVVLYADKAALCGPAGDDPPTYVGLDVGQVERICREALEQPDRHAALRALRDGIPAVNSDLAGVRNEGFLATHELRAGAKQREDWDAAGAKALKIVGRRGKDLLTGLGFQVESHDRVVSILRARDRKVAVAVLLNPSEAPELQAERFSNMSPISYALAVADNENLPYVVVHHGAKVRIYPSRLGVGVGRRGPAETYVECHVGLLRDSEAAYLWLLCSAEALAEGGSLEQLIEESRRFAGGLAEQLRERIYQNVVPRLAAGIVAARRLKKPSTQDLADTYEMAMTVLFRLLFIAYAEDKDLLPYQRNGLYQKRSLKEKAKELLSLTQAGTPFDAGDSLWEEVSRLFRAVDRGNPEWGVPPYDGGLFTSDRDVSRVGALLEGISLPNTTLGPALRDLLLVDTNEGLGPVDFRSLGVREFGTVYEGLLESELSVAETDLAVDKAGVYRPCKKGETALVEKGSVYLHNASGARKATGSYFTKDFAVEHLLERSLDKALADHLAQLPADDDAAADRLFDFRVADIAMGSGHFLVAAVDHIERAFRGYLAKRPLPGVAHELATLRAAALESLGAFPEDIEDQQLLRRQIARRCIYGVDINHTAVQLARLAIWIHTFVPGLPLSLLDHNLVHGNSLVGIATLGELRDFLESDSTPLFPVDASHLLGDAREHLARLARIADANLADLKRAREALRKARAATQPAEGLCDLVTHARIEGAELAIKIEDWGDTKHGLFQAAKVSAARDALEGLKPFHFPIAFPEVFLRARPGFDVIVGNPPWDKTQVEEHGFWSRHVPGLMGVTQGEREKIYSQLRKSRPDLVRAFDAERAASDAMRRALMTGPFPGMGDSHPDLYKAFCWRFWNLVAEGGGRIGIVLPRSALAAKGSTEFRRELFEHGDQIDITTLLNTKGWVFDEAEPRYTVGLVAFEKRESKDPPVMLRGPYSSLDRYHGGLLKAPAVFYGREIAKWTETAALPLLPTEEGSAAFAQLRKSPPVDLVVRGSWSVRPVQGDLNSTGGKKHMTFEDEKRGRWPVYKGSSFNIWEPSTGDIYAWIEPLEAKRVLAEKRLRGAKQGSGYGAFPKPWLKDPRTLPCLHARVAFRRICRATDSRTMIAALVPPEVVLVDTAPFLLWPTGNERDHAFLLGVLSSIPLDWYARRFVETHMDFHVFNPLPVPRPSATDKRADRAVLLASRLASPDDRFNTWAKAVGVACGPLEANEKADMIHELDAVVAHLYGLSERHLIHIFETFHEGWDYEERLRATLKHFASWKGRA
jgi:hypothetical protein